MTKIFTVTAGHSDAEPGAVRGAITEAALMTELRDIVVLKLRQAGHTVRTDGDRRRNLRLVEALKLIKGAHVAIELHTNAVASTAARGVEVFSLPGRKELARRLAGAIAGVLSTTVRGEGGWKDQSASQHGTLGFVGRGGLLVEVFFLSNPMELEAYQARKWLVAQAIVDALLEA